MNQPTRRRFLTTALAATIGGMAGTYSNLHADNKATDPTAEKITSFEQSLIDAFPEIETETLKTIAQDFVATSNSNHISPISAAASAGLAYSFMNAQELSPHLLYAPTLAAQYGAQALHSLPAMNEKLEIFSPRAISQQYNLTQAEAASISKFLKSSYSQKMAIKNGTMPAVASIIAALPVENQLNKFDVNISS